MPGGQVSEGNGVGIRIQAFFNGLLERALLTDAQRTRILDEILKGEAAINPSLTRHLPGIKKGKSRHTQGAA